MIRIITLFSILLSLEIQAQITIGAAEMPHAGDELFRTKAAYNPFIDFATAGPAHNWDFTDLTASAQESTEYGTVSSTGLVYSIAYADLFFNPNRANHATDGVDIPFNQMLPIEDPYTFYHRSSSEYKKVGYGANISGIPVPIIFEDHDVIYPLPLYYSQTNSSYSSYQIDVPTLAYYGYQQVRHLWVDGWGDITTPAGTFEVLRVVTRIEGRDSINVDQLSTGFAIDRPTTYEYKWLAQGLRVPVLQINTVEVFGVEVVTEIFFHDEERTITVLPPIGTALCAGNTLEVDFEATGTFNAGGFLQQGNNFQVQLSDANGDFSTPINIGQMSGTTSGSINATIPADLPGGSGYRIRVVATNPVVIGDDNGFDIAIGSMPVAEVLIEGELQFCAGGSVVLSADGPNDLQFAWSRNGEVLPDATGAQFEAIEAGEYALTVSNGCGSSTSEMIVVEVNETPEHIFDQASHVVCDGSSATLNAINTTGLNGLEYEWYHNNEAVSGDGTEMEATASGAFHVVITDPASGCSFTTSTVDVLIENAIAPSIEALGNTSFCDGGSVTLQASGAEGAIFQWMLDGMPIGNAIDDQYIALSSGSYSAQAILPGGCMSDPSAAIDVDAGTTPAAALIEASDATTFCSGASVVLSAPGTEDLDHTWMLNGDPIEGVSGPVLTVSTSGVYGLIVSMGGCAAPISNTIEINVVEAPAIPEVSASNTTICEGGKVMLSVAVEAGNMVQWTLDNVPIEDATGTDLIVTASGAYSVIVANTAGCTAQAVEPVTVEVMPFPTEPVIEQQGNTLVTTGEGGFQWFLNGELIEGATSATYDPGENGIYTVAVTVNGCTSTSEEFLFISTGISQVPIESGRAYPNPSTGILFLEVPGAAFGDTWSVTDATGRLVLSGTIGGDRTRIDLGDRISGLYFIRVQADGGEKVMRIILSR